MERKNDVHNVFLSRHDNSAHVGINFIGLLRLPAKVMYGLVSTVGVYPLLNFYVFVSAYCKNHKYWQEKMQDLPRVQFIVCEDDKITGDVVYSLQGMLVVQELWCKQIKSMQHLLAVHNGSTPLEKQNAQDFQCHSDEQRLCHNPCNHSANLFFPGDRGERVIAGVGYGSCYHHVRTILYSIAYTQTVMGTVHPCCNYVVESSRIDCSPWLSQAVELISNTAQVSIDIVESHRVGMIFADKYDIVIAPIHQAQLLRDAFWQGCKFYDQIMFRQMYRSKWRRYLLNLMGVTKDLEYLSGYAATDYYAGALDLEITNLPVVTFAVHNTTLVSFGAALSLVADVAVYNTLMLLRKYLQKIEKSDLMEMV